MGYIMKFRILIGAALSSVVLATSSFAATLSVGDGADFTLTDGFNPSGSVIADYGLTTGVGGTVVQQFTSASTTGLDLLGGSSPIRIKFLGTEASATNTAFSIGSSVLDNKLNAINDTVFFVSGAGLVDFTFSTIFSTNPLVDGSIQNGGGGTGHYQNLSMSFLQIDDENVLAFFGDGRFDQDIDDMVVLISAVPLPAGGLLLLSAFGGFAAFRRRKSKQA